MVLPIPWPAAGDLANEMNSLGYNVFIMLISFKDLADIIIRFQSTGITVPYNRIEKVFGV
jgi:hypothetical protein